VPKPQERKASFLPMAEARGIQRPTFDESVQSNPLRKAGLERESGPRGAVQGLGRVVEWAYGTRTRAIANGEPKTERAGGRTVWTARAEPKLARTGQGSVKWRD